MGKAGSKCLLSGVGLVLGGEWVTEVLRGFSAAGKEALSGGPRWEDSDGWSWGDFAEFSVSPNEQRASNKRRAEPSAS